MSTPRLTRRAALRGTCALGLAALDSALRARPGLAQEPPNPPPCTFTVDAHCHVFNVLDLPIDGFIVALGHGMGFPRALDPYVGWATKHLHEKLCALALRRDPPRQRRTQIDQLLQKKYLAPLVARIGNPAREALAGTLEVATRPRLEVAQELCDTYRSTNLFLPALVDYKYWDARGRSTRITPTHAELPEQIDSHAAVMKVLNTKSGQDLPRVHGYVPFNPLRQVLHERDERKEPVDPLEQLRRAVGIGDHQPGLGYVGVKLYSPTGFVPLGNARLPDLQREGIGEALDAAMHKFFELCEEHHIPILAHTSDTNAYDDGYGRRASPWGWGRTLAAYPNLRVNLGHFGQRVGLTDDAAVLDCLAWSKRIAKLMAEYPHVYADLSYSPMPFDAALRAKHVDYLQREIWSVLSSANEPAVEQRLLYGTDWWMMHMEATFADYQRTFRQIIQDLSLRIYPQRPADALRLQQRFFGANALAFLGPEALGRLGKYYEHLRAAKPEWISGVGGACRGGRE